MVTELSAFSGCREKHSGVFGRIKRCTAKTNKGKLFKLLPRGTSANLPFLRRHPVGAAADAAADAATRDRPVRRKNEENRQPHRHQRREKAVPHRALRRRRAALLQPPPRRLGPRARLLHERQRLLPHARGVRVDKLERHGGVGVQKLEGHGAVGAEEPDRHGGVGVEELVESLHGLEQSVRCGVEAGQASRGGGGGGGGAGFVVPGEATSSRRRRRL